jgi:methyl-accepting chemotaxis protein
MATTDVDQDRDVILGQLHEALQRLRDGDFSVRLPVEWSGLPGQVARVFNSMVETLGVLSSEFIRITVEVGTQGMYGGQAEVEGVSGRWLEMVDSLNRMGFGLTLEVRRTSTAARAWAEGDASQRLQPELIGGELAEMQQRLNAAMERWVGTPGK